MVTMKANHKPDHPAVRGAQDGAHLEELDSLEAQRDLRELSGSGLFQFLSSKPSAQTLSAGSRTQHAANENGGCRNALRATSTQLDGAQGDCCDRDLALLRETGVYRYRPLTDAVAYQKELAP